MFRRSAVVTLFWILREPPGRVVVAEARDAADGGCEHDASGARWLHERAPTEPHPQDVTNHERGPLASISAPARS